MSNKFIIVVVVLFVWFILIVLALTYYVLKNHKLKIAQLEEIKKKREEQEVQIEPSSGGISLQNEIGVEKENSPKSLLDQVENPMKGIACVEENLRISQK